MLIVKFRGLIDKIIQVLSTIIMGVMVIAVCWQVITRYILNNPSTVTEEALRYLLIWVTMVGGAYAYGRRKHLAITALSKRLSFKGQKILDIFVQAMVILFCVVVMIGGGTRLVNTAADQLSAALQLPMPLIYASVPVGAILFIFYALIFIGEDLRDMKQGPQGQSLPKKHKKRRTNLNGYFSSRSAPDRHVCAAAGAERPGLGQYHHFVGRDHGLHPVSGSGHLRCQPAHGGRR